MLRKMVYDTWGFDPGKNHTFDAAGQLCLENTFDPVVDYDRFREELVQICGLEVA